MSDDSENPGIEPGPDPDTTTAAIPFDADEVGLDPEDAPVMIDENGGIVEEKPGQ